MIVILVLGIHFLLMSVYAYMQLTNRSRLNPSYLLFALCFPFVGELCLLAAEIGAVPAKSKYEKEPPVPKHTSAADPGWICPEDYEAIVMGDENQARLFLMDAIDHAETPLLSGILKKALYAQSSEVSHIAAAGLMRLNKKYEDSISNAKLSSEAMENNIHLLALYIDSVHDYLASGLPDASSAQELKATERSLLEKYLKSMSQDEYYQNRLKELTVSEDSTNG